MVICWNFGLSFGGFRILLVYHWKLPCRLTIRPMHSLIDVFHLPNTTFASLRSWEISSCDVFMNQVPAVPIRIGCSSSGELSSNTVS